MKKLKENKLKTSVLFKIELKSCQKVDKENVQVQVFIITQQSCKSQQSLR